MWNSLTLGVTTLHKNCKKIKTKCRPTGTEQKTKVQTHFFCVCKHTFITRPFIFSRSESSEKKENKHIDEEFPRRDLFMNQ